MGLSLLNALPDPAAQIRSLQQELFSRNKQLNEAHEELSGLRNELAAERRKRFAIESGVKEMRTVLTPLYMGLQHIFGEIEAMGVDAPASGPVANPKNNSAIWDSWKQRLGGAAAKIIDVLMLHGELNQAQIAIHIGTSRKQTVYDAVSKLNKAGIINKSGDGKISLKEIGK